MTIQNDDQLSITKKALKILQKGIEEMVLREDELNEEEKLCLEALESEEHDLIAQIKDYRGRRDPDDNQ